MNEIISLQDLVVRLTEKFNSNPDDAETLVKKCFDIMEEGLVNDKFLKIRNLGTFKLAWVEDSESVVVSTGEKVLIPAHYTVTFSPDIELSEIVNAPYASMETAEIEETGYRERIEDALDDSDDEDEVNENSAQSGYFWSRPETPQKPESMVPEDKPTEPGKKPEVVAEPEKPQEEPEIIEVKPEITEKVSETTEVKPEDKKEEKFENEEEEEPEYYEPYDEDHSWIQANKGLFRFLVLIISGLILFFAGRYFYPKIQTASIADSVSVYSSSTGRTEHTGAESQEPAKENDSATTPAVDTQPKNQPQETQKVERQPAKKHIDTHYTILEGERLNIIALREYGHKAFWVYIYDENREVIYDPDRIEPGTVIYIPPMEKYGIDKDNPESVNKALILQQQYKKGEG
ncbi:MAG: HU family DNA-binding protein [Dysgonamonadaceae bacterium]|jgi:nucleoid DNA-binding protein|nr:HU family DNA-binding protein [Dysgonamonadaceae bacterium]